jgi:hypothetical protein
MSRIRRHLPAPLSGFIALKSEFELIVIGEEKGHHDSSPH